MPGNQEHDDCVFCGLVHGRSRETWVLDEPRISALLDTNPVFKGHVLVLPRDHHPTLADLPTDLVPLG